MIKGILTYKMYGHILNIQDCTYILYMAYELNNTECPNTHWILWVPKELWVRHRVHEVGAEDVEAESLGSLIGHLDTILQDGNWEEVARITGQPQTEVRVDLVRVQLLWRQTHSMNNVHDVFLFDIGSSFGDWMTKCWENGKFKGQVLQFIHWWSLEGTDSDEIILAESPEFFLQTCKGTA